MAGTIIADTIQAGGSFIRLNNASQTVATINASGLYSNTGNLIISASGTVVNNTAISGTMTQSQIGTNIATTGPAFSVYLNSNQTLSATVYQKIAFAAEDYDTANCFDSTTNYRFTPNVAGYYQFNAAITVTAAQVMLLAFYKNGSSHKRTAYSYSSPVFVVSGSALIYLNGSTDYVELIGRSETGGTAYGSSTNETWFQGYLVRAA